MAVPTTFARGTLPARADAAIRRARASGALVPIETEGIVIDDGGVPFVVRSASGLRRKDADREQRRRQAAPVNPFLPPEADLVVADVSPTHVAVLNKFSVIERHLLIVTRAYEHQARWLTRDDFAALAACMAEFASLGFYNGGAPAGASQPHKHLQLVPLPLAAAGPAVPAGALIEASLAPDGVAQVAGFAFVAAACRLDGAAFADPPRAALRLQDRFEAAAARAGVRRVDAADGPRQSMPYNLLVTRDWLLVVPRAREHAEGISINALGFAGSLFVRDAAALARLRAMGPMRALATVGVPR